MNRGSTPAPRKSAKRTYETTPVKAIEGDAQSAGTLAGYSIKNWDPNELPIVLLGSVFDANSLGNWKYDWTAKPYSAGSKLFLNPL